jgi:hypothetical protein
MAARDTIFDAFDRCIDRIHRGETVDAVLQDYREFANDLRPMLEAGLLLPRARFPAEVVSGVEQSLEPLIRETIATVFKGGAIAGTTLLLLLLLAGAIITVVVVVLATRGDTSSPPTATAAPLIAPSSTPPAALTRTPTPTVTPTATASPTAAASVTPSPVVGVIVIEGAVSAINGNIITIFDREIALDPDDPRLTTIQVDDVLRVEGRQEGVIIRVINITFISVTVVVEGDQVWRDDNCSSPPPVWAQGQAVGWQRRCGGGVNNPGGNGGGNGDSGGDDDDDDD